MVDLGGAGEKALGIGASILKYGLFFIIVLIVIVVAIVIIVWSKRRKKWNLKVIVKLPRAGQLIFGEFAKGHYDTVAGIVDIKRKHMKSVGMKPFDVKRFLQGNKILEVMQTGATEFIPIDPESYKILHEKYKDNKGKTHESKKALFTMVTDDSLKRKTWKTYMERAAKNRFTLAGFLDKHWRAIELGIITFIMFLGFTILWIRLPSICG